MSVDIVTVMDLREHAGKLVRSIEYGEFTVVAERGKPGIPVVHYPAEEIEQEVRSVG